MNNAKCSVCGQEYEICNSCLDQKKIKPWRTITDTIDHYKIYLAIHGYTISKDKEKAKLELKKCDLTGIDNFNTEIKSAIKEILAESKKKPVQKQTKINTEKSSTVKIENEFNE